MGLADDVSELIKLKRALEFHKGCAREHRKSVIALLAHIRALEERVNTELGTELRQYLEEKGE